PAMTGKSTPHCPAGPGVTAVVGKGEGEGVGGTRVAVGTTARGVAVGASAGIVTTASAGVVSMGIVVTAGTSTCATRVGTAAGATAGPARGVLHPTKNSIAANQTDMSKDCCLRIDYSGPRPHKITDPSPLPEAMIFPAGSQSRPHTVKRCPSKSASGRPVAICHTLMVRSALPEASKVPSTDQSNAHTPPRWPLRVACCCQVPAVHSPVRPLALPAASIALSGDQA